MKNLFNSILVVALVLFSVQCTIIEEEDLINPNAPSPDAVDPDFLLNSIQLSNAGLFEQMSSNAASLIRMEHMFGTTYNNAFSPQSFDGEWTTAYAGILIDVETLIPVANERELFVHAGIARVIRAYVLINLVDQFGDVPLTEALDPSNFNPSVDPGEQVYDFAFADLDSAKLAFAKNPLALPANDVYYGGDADSWTALANTLQAKVLFQRGDLGGALSILNNQEVIDAPGEEWAFPYSTTSANPDSRHPKFVGNYLTGAAEYMANYFMNELWQDKSVPDPRIRYYLYRQTDAPTTDVNEQQCINNPPPSHYTGTTGNGVGDNDPHCEDWNDVGYWGRDHGNSLGIPPDNLLRTTWGPFPAGGRFDADQAAGVSEDQGMQGAGIQPLWLPFYTDFMRAEIAATTGDAGTARTTLETAIRNSIDFVQGFSAPAVAAETDGDTFEPSDADIDTYVNDVLARFDAAASDEERMGTVAKEWYLALWGNGIDGYNLYRRTSYPRDIQPHLAPDPGTFIRSFEYPADVVETNSNIQQKPGDGVRVFWDDSDFNFDF